MAARAGAIGRKSYGWPWWKTLAPMVGTWPVSVTTTGSVWTSTVLSCVLERRVTTGLRHRVLAFEWRSISRFVNSTKPKICVHSETMLPTTWPHLASESIQA